jgi:protein-S-isoprenylcysteine O-methyltransferase Ste14
LRRFRQSVAVWLGIEPRPTQPANDQPMPRWHGKRSNSQADKNSAGGHNGQSARAQLAAMTLYGWLIFGLWLILVAYWSLSTSTVMRRVGNRWIWWREIPIRLGFFAVVVLALRVAVSHHMLPNANPYAFNSSLTLGLIGFICAVFGVALAILARAYLGRNWGAPEANRQAVELVTTGPYHWVCHPLYSGLLFAILGSALGLSVFWLLPLIVYGPYFVRGARREEKLLIEQFPDRYPAYMRRTKMLLPFVL